MGAASIATTGKANLRADGSIRTSGRFRPLSQTIPRLARVLWPAKTDAELASRTGTSDRRCREFLAERAGLSAEALAALLRSDAGLEVLEALIGPARPAWWQRFRRTIELGSMREEIEMQRRSIEAAREALAGLEIEASLVHRSRGPARG